VHQLLFLNFGFWELIGIFIVLGIPAIAAFVLLVLMRRKPRADIGEVTCSRCGAVGLPVQNAFSGPKCARCGSTQWIAKGTQAYSLSGNPLAA